MNKNYLPLVAALLLSCAGLNAGFFGGNKAQHAQYAQAQPARVVSRGLSNGQNIDATKLPVAKHEVETSYLESEKQNEQAIRRELDNYKSCIANCQKNGQNGHVAKLQQQLNDLTVKLQECKAAQSQHQNNLRRSQELGVLN